jgi:DNA-binding XRE family transcriptional regulator
LGSGIAHDPRHRRLAELDAELSELKAAFEEALGSFTTAFGEVVGRPDIDASIEGRLDDVAGRLRNLKPDIEALNFDVEQSAALFSAMVDIDRATHASEDDLDRFEQILLGIERIRQVIRDALDEFVGGANADRRRLASALAESLPGVTQAELAEVLGVDPRTVRRWSNEAGPPDHRLLTVARLVSVLRHAWTPAGVMAWFHRERRDLDGAAPMALLGEPSTERALMSAARSSRNQYGS